MKKKIFIRNISVIIIILTVVFLSQQPYFRGYGKDIYDKAESQVTSYWSKAGDWVKLEVAKRGDTFKDEVNKGKNNVAQNIWEKIKNYFSGAVDSVFNPNKNNSQKCDQSCQPAK